MNPENKAPHPLTKVANVIGKPEDFKDYKHPAYPKKADEITVRAVYIGKNDTQRKVRFLTMEMALSQKLLQQADYIISDPAFESKLIEHCKRKKIKIETIRRSHIKK